METLRVVLVGGSGFIGSALTPALLEAGHAVTVLTRRASAARAKVDRRAEVVEWDARSTGAWEETVGGADGVVNLAGESLAAGRWTAEQKERLRASRLVTASAIVRAMEKRSVRPAVLVNASGVGYYGTGGDAMMDEEAPAGKGFLAALCEERETAARAAEALGMRVVQMRIGMVLGKGSPLLSRLVPVFRALAVGSLGSGRQWWPWIHLEDVTGLFQLALENESARGPMNVTAPEPVRMAEFARTLGRVLGRPSWLPVPAPALRSLLGERAEMLLASQRAVPRAALALGYRYRFAELEPALRAVLRR